MRLVVNSSGSVVASSIYDEFGIPETDPEYAAGSAGLRPHGFIGGLGVRNDWASSGLHYTRQRYYDPQLGRFLSQDPIGFAGGPNLYVGMANNPINAVDPEGTDVLVIQAGPAGGVSVFGHMGMAVEGYGVYSYGTADRNGAGIYQFINKYTQKGRWVRILRVKTTSAECPTVASKSAQDMTRAYNAGIKRGDPHTCANNVCISLGTLGLETLPGDHVPAAAYSQIRDWVKSTPNRIPDYDMELYFKAGTSVTPESHPDLRVFNRGGGNQ